MSVCRLGQSVPPVPPLPPIQCDLSARSAVVVPADIAVVVSADTVVASADTVVVSVAVSVALADIVADIAAFVEALLGIAMLDCMDTRTYHHLLIIL